MRDGGVTQASEQNVSGEHGLCRKCTSVLGFEMPKCHKNAKRDDVVALAEGDPGTETWYGSTFLQGGSPPLHSLRRAAAARAAFEVRSSSPTT